MSAERRNGPDEKDALLREIGVGRARSERYGNARPASVASRLAQIGVLGWIIFLPILVGIFLGRWLDRLFATGLLFTAPLLMIGIGIGAYSAWKWMRAA